MALLLFYAAEQAWSEGARQHGVQLLHASGAPVEVDQSLWSSQRIAAFAESILSPGVPEGLLRIPAVALEVPIYSGSSELNLNRGAAHIEGTAALASHGNVGIAGHRDGFFRKLKDVSMDSEIDIDVGGRSLRYRVVDMRIVDPSDAQALAPTPVPSITLVTCYPFYYVGSAPQRYIVRAEIDTPAQHAVAGRYPISTTGE